MYAARTSLDGLEEDQSDRGDHGREPRHEAVDKPSHDRSHEDTEHAHETEQANYDTGTLLVRAAVGVSGICVRRVVVRWASQKECQRHLCGNSIN